METTIDKGDPSTATWSVCRQDDNGTQFVVESGLNREAANKRVAWYETLGHKQTYWVEADKNGDRR
jgi:hypothetical protein